MIISLFLPFSSHNDDVKCLVPPKFTPLPSSTAVGIEDESMVISLLATGNPANIQYTWSKEGSPLEEHGEY